MTSGQPLTGPSRALARPARACPDGLPQSETASTRIDAFMTCPSGATALRSLEPRELVSELAALLTVRTPMCTGGDGLYSSANGSVQAGGADDGMNKRHREEVRTQGTD